MVFQTDKSGRFSLDTTENYKRSCEEHIQNDTIIMAGQYKKLEQEMNAHSVMRTRILQAGKDNGNEGWIRNNMVSCNSPLPPLYTLRKDHKKCNDP